MRLCMNLVSHSNVGPSHHTPSDLATLGHLPLKGGGDYTPGHRTTGGIELSIVSTFPPVLSPKVVPRS